ncbi:hypothetical protein CB0940_06773 [Cercospora beticola]|uniref:Uncharacterized protein n=1 Tax=Cercospora beticola TaxID=122368 RepID=A0A2G5H955_CERBT|nr:hypothetical protein CB0940_06773 [Cercospora beticola]PIA89051.1 hypothetical protein CB0940_06773 [Cercospora beticola]WPB02685.1 hypothetical protein RHO25_007321 [Cercospora beticola]
MAVPSIQKAGLPTRPSLPLGLDKSNSLDQNTALITALQALDIMGGPTWTIEERRDLLRMRTDYDLTDEQVHDLIGRIYGEAWRNSSPQRKKYTIKDIRDEISSRWKAGHRNGHYETIDPENGVYDANETYERARSDQRIRNAAHQTGGLNWLREDGQGALATPNMAIPLHPKPTPYRRDPASFAAAFATEQAQKAGGRAAQPAMMPGGQGSDTTARPRRAATARTPTTSAKPPQTGTSSRPSRSSAARNTATSIPPSQAEQPTVEPTPNVPTRPGRNPAVRASQKLEMVHGQDIDVENDRLTLPSDRVVKTVDKSLAIYKHGGELIHVWNPRRQRFDDLIRCDGDVCNKCNDCGRSGGLAIKIRRSPTDGLPFVHLGQNSIQNNNGEYIFSHTGAPSNDEFTVPPHRHTVKVEMWCRSGGEDMRVTVLGCVAERCAICSPATFERDGGDMDYHKNGGFYGENDVVESDGEESVCTDTDDDGPAGSAGEAEDEDAEDATSVAGENEIAID